VLLCKLEDPSTLNIGSLGQFNFAAGSYAYVGSARGPGGLAARLKRHFRPPEQKQPHWHIDYFLARARLQGVTWSVETHAIECEWSNALAGQGVRWPRRFGASDCRCEGHLIGLRHESSILDISAAIPGELEYAEITQQ
jgi:Uri superfamily endonuclease